ncbi:MAG: ZPR1 zinc finger domain-containing protein [Candidatus Odinarchaeia archaeon]
MEDKIKCPVCKKGDLKINTSRVDIPYYGPVILLALKCEKCGFKTTDIFLEKINPPTRYKAKIKTIKDQEIKVIKSSTAFISSPELGVKMEPGIASQGYITNVEGILLKFKDFTEMVKGWTDDESKKNRCDQVLKKIDLVLKGEVEITLILEDPYGNSLLIGTPQHKIVKEVLTDKEIENLKSSIIY